MTYEDNHLNHIEQMLLRRMTHIVATVNSPREAVVPALEVAQSLTDAVGGALIVFEESASVDVIGIDRSQLPSFDDLQQLAEDLYEGIYINPELSKGMTVSTAGWLAGVVRGPDRVIGLLWLLFDSVPKFTNDEEIAMIALMDGMTIVARNLLSVARQEKLSRNQSEFMRIVSHDLRSPLTAMQGFASMLEMVGDLNEKQTHFANKILSGITQMTSIVDNFQDAGRFDPETGFYEMERAPCDLTDVVQRIIRTHLLPAEKQELTIKTVIADDIPIINVDANMIERAITNLIDNAIKYTPNGRNILVGLHREDESIVISVADNGLGISEENQKMLFERHVRIPRREHKKVKGSGLGLFIVRSVAQRHGGRAWVKSEEGKGTTFYISIPLTGQNMLFSGTAGD